MSVISCRMATTTAEIAARLKRARAANGMTASAAATAVGIGRTTLYRYEDGQTDIPAITALLLAETYGTTVGWLLGAEAPADLIVDGVHYIRRESSILTMGEREALQEPQQNRDEDRERS